MSRTSTATAAVSPSPTTADPTCTTPTTCPAAGWVQTGDTDNIAAASITDIRIQRTGPLRPTTSTAAEHSPTRPPGRTQSPDGAGRQTTHPPPPPVTHYNHLHHQRRRRSMTHTHASRLAVTPRR